MKIMIVKYSPWDYDSYYESKHPEYVAIRDAISQNLQDDYVLVGLGGATYRSVVSELNPASATVQPPGSSWIIQVC